MTKPAHHPPLDLDRAWALLRGLTARARRGTPVIEPCGLRCGPDGELVDDEAGAELWIRPREGRGWAMPPHASVLDTATVALLDLYTPLCIGARSADLVVGHLGQSLDGRIATHGGVSQFITGPENIEHSHRLRALCDAVVVGARTVEHDDPQLTTRLVPGTHAVRVVIDPRRRLGTEYRVFSDDAAPTLLFCAGSAAGAPARHGGAEVVPVADADGDLPVTAVLAELRRRGHRRVFIEGGGLTVSRFLQAGALDRLHVAVAPVILGSGRPAFSLPVIDTLEGALALDCRHFVTGADVLFDCIVRPEQ